MKILRLVALACLLPLSLLATVTSQVDKSGPFLITAVPQTIPTGFPFVSGSELLVLDTGPTASPYDPARVLTLGSDYTVTGGNYNGANQMLSGSIVVVGTGTHAVAANDYLVIMRNVPINQTSSFTTTGPLTVTLLEQALDKMATLSQQVNEIGSRSLQFENFEFRSGVLNKALRENTVLGFDGSGNPQFLTLPTSLADITGSTATATGATSARTLGNFFADVLNVKDYGAAGDGVTDDTASIQAGIDYLSTHSGGTLYLPAGTYKLTNTLTINTNGIQLVGAGMYDTILTRSTDYGDTVLFTGNDTTGTLLSNTGISNLTLKSTGLTTSGAQLHLNGVFNCNVENVNVLQGFVGFHLAGATATTLRNTHIQIDNIFGGSATNRVFVQIDSAAITYAHPACGDLLVTDFNWRNGATAVVQYGIVISSADGLFFNNGHSGGTTGANLNMVADGGQYGVVLFNNIMFDEATAPYNVLFQGSAIRGRFIQFNNCQIAGNNLCPAGVTVAATAQFSDVTFTGCRIFQHYNNGVDLQSTSSYRFDFIGCVVQNNNVSNSANTYGYKIGANVGSVSITGGVAGGLDQIVCNQAFGIAVLAGTGDDLVFTHVDCSYNTTGGVIMSASGDNNHVFECPDGSTNTVTAATAIALPLGSELVNVSGNTDINNITAMGFGQKVTLKFAGTPTVKDGTGNLKLAGDFVATADDTLSLVCDGTNWIETARSAN